MAGRGRAVRTTPPPGKSCTQAADWGSVTMGMVRFGPKVLGTGPKKQSIWAPFLIHWVRQGPWFGVSRPFGSSGSIHSLSPVGLGAAAAATVAPYESPHDIVRPSDCRSFSNGGLPSATAAMDRGSSRSPAPSTTAAAARPPSPSPSATSSAPDHPRQHGPALDVRSSRSPAPFATATKKKAASPAPSKKKVAKKKAVLPVPSATLPPPKVPSSLPLFLRPRWSQLSSYFEPPHGLKSISLTLDGLTCIAMWNLF